jgi:hypothetical protein
MSVLNSAFHAIHTSRVGLTIAAMMVAAMTFFAVIAAGAALFLEQPERVIGVHEAVAAAATERHRSESEGAAPVREPERDGSGAEAGDVPPAEAHAVAVAGIVIDSGIDETSFAAAAAALAIEVARDVL